MFKAQKEGVVTPMKSSNYKGSVSIVEKIKRFTSRLKINKN